MKPFEPEAALEAECRITTFQDQYFYTNNFEEAKEKLRFALHSVILFGSSDAILANMIRQGFIAIRK